MMVERWRGGVGMRVRILAALVTIVVGLGGLSVATAAPVAAGVLAAADPSPSAGGLTMLRPTRVLDTRSGLGVPAGLRSSGSVTTLPVLGYGGVPTTGVAAVAITVTVTAATGEGNVSAYGSTTPPLSSTVNYAPGRTVSNLAVVPVGSDGAIRLRNSGGAVHLIGDVSGWVAGGPATSAGGLASVPPARLLDTRNGTGAPRAKVTGPGYIALQVTGHGGVPVGAQAAMLNVTVVRPSRAGYVSVTPTSAAPTTSSLNFGAGDIIANLVSAPLSSTGQAFIHVSAGAVVDLVVDVGAYVVAGDPTGAAGTILPVAPARLQDTRPTVLAPGATLLVDTGSPPIGATVAAAILNVTATGASGNGFVVVGAAGGGTPGTSPLSLRPGVAAASLVLAPVDASHLTRLTVSSSASTSLVVDLVGYVLGDPTTASDPPPVTGLAGQGATITWTFPAGTSATSVLVRRAPGPTPPASPYAGTAVSRTMSASSTFTDTSTSPGGVYSYAVFTGDAGGSYSEATTTASLTPRAGQAWVVNRPGVPFVGGPADVSCPTTTFCMAVDRTGRAITWNGTSWSAPQVVFAPDQYAVQSFEAVSCPSATFCLGVAGGEGYAVWTGGAWTTHPFVSGGGVWSTVDCNLPTSCLVGDGNVGSGRPAHLGRWDGTSIVGVTTLSTLEVVAAISCPSATTCVVLGTKGTSSFALRQNGTGWSTQRLGSVQASVVPHLDVSCPTTTYCLAISAESGYFWQLKGTTWTSGARVTDASGEWMPGEGVSCSSTTSCDLVSGNENAHWNGSTWVFRHADSLYDAAQRHIDCASNACVVVDGTGRYRKGTGTVWSGSAVFDRTSGSPTDVSCDTASSCWLSDGFGNVMHWSGTAWGGLSTLWVYLSLLDCPAAGSCLSADGQNAQSRVLRSGAWTGPTTFGRTNPLTGLSCASTSRCVALLLSSYYVWNGSTWSGEHLLPAGFIPTALRCPTASWCMATDTTAGKWATWNGVAWSTPRVLPLANENTWRNLSCTSATFCMAWSSGDSYATFNGSAWSPVRHMGDSSATVLGCQSATLCYGATYLGTLWSWGGTDWAPTAVDLGFQPYRMDCTTGRCMVVGDASAAWTS